MTDPDQQLRVLALFLICAILHLIMRRLSSVERELRTPDRADDDAAGAAPSAAAGKDDERAENFFERPQEASGRWRSLGVAINATSVMGSPGGGSSDQSDLAPVSSTSFFEQNFMGCHSHGLAGGHDAMMSHDELR